MSPDPRDPRIDPDRLADTPEGRRRERRRLLYRGDPFAVDGRGEPIDPLARLSLAGPGRAG
jgi:hypothetical protein